MKMNWRYDEPLGVKILGWLLAIILTLGVAFGLVCLERHYPRGIWWGYRNYFLASRRHLHFNLVACRRYW